MKPALVVALCLVTSAAIAQWRPQPLDTTADFRGLSVAGAGVAWVTGTGGTFARTTDGGKTWTVGTVPGAAELDFRAVKGFNATTAYLMSAGPGGASRIYKTADGGKSWAKQYQAADPAAFLDAVAFWDDTTGLALGDPVGGKFQLIATTDGTTWAPLKNPPAALPGEAAFAASGTALVCRGEADAWFVSGGGKSARVFRTRDRGQTWTAADAPIAAGVESAGAFSIAFRDDTHGVIVGGDYRKPADTGATAARTADGGKSWTAVEKQLPFCSAAAWAGDRWVAVGPTGSFASRDDGATWQRLDRENFNSVGFAAGAGWAAGPKGRVAALGR